ncbi:MAG: hypothetical protein ACTHMK_15660 [Dyella sp.]|uniref:hypothetical protein n=1 Tax=Dyella sp. TaxID=1869338 RepID=UPI003F803471
MTSLRSFPTGLILLLASAVAGFFLALYAYFAPLTGVTGTVGALAVIVSCAVLAAMALALGAVGKHAARITLRVSIGLLLLATCFAALLLHRWGICVAMGAGLVGLVMEVLRSAGTRHGAHA